jgi:aromatic ring hydroxylase
LGPARDLHIWFTQVSGRMIELMREICASGIIMQPSEKDLANPEIGQYLDRYMRGKNVDVEYKSRLFRLAHDLAPRPSGCARKFTSTGTAATPTATASTCCAASSRGR